MDLGSDVALEVYVLQPPPPPPPFEYRGDELHLAAVSSVYPRLLAENREAFLVVGNAEAFGRGGLGDPPAVVALRTLATDPMFADALKEVLRRGGMGGQLYSLCGLYYVDHPTFAFPLPWFRQLVNVMVETNQGCIIEQRSVADIVGNIENGEYPKELLGQALGETDSK